MAKHPHVASANKYARSIVAGKIAACVWVRLACERYLRDLEKEKKGAWPYRFDKDQAERWCNFVQHLPHIKGEWAGTPITLEPWQKFSIANVFGWVRKADNMRRFRTVYEEIPRKNAKSTKLSTIALGMTTLDGEPGAECYSAATTRDQAKIVFADAQNMARRSADFREAFGVEVGAHAVYVLDTASKFEALSADSSTLDGLNIHFAGVDELHAHKTRKVWEVLETGTGARRQPLIWAITTAGSNKAGVCYETRTYLTKVLEGTATDETFFGIIYTIDDGDDWREESSWKKANPNYGISVKPDDLKRKASKAMQLASATNGFLTKHLNVWVNADTRWLPPNAWEKRANFNLGTTGFEGQPVIVALDMASKDDVACMILLFRKGDDYFCFPKFYLPEDTIEESDNSQYAGWASDGYITVTPGNIIDFEYIEDDLRAAAKSFRLDSPRLKNPRHVVLYDPFQATQFSTRMSGEGMAMVEYGATVKNFSEPMKQLSAMVVERGDGPKIWHDGNPVMTWMMSNVVCHTDAKDNIFPRKEIPANKIDGPVALIMAIGWEMRQGTKKTCYEDRGVRAL